MSSVLRNGPGDGASRQPSAGPPPSSPPAALLNGAPAPPAGAEQRNQLNVIAGIGVLLLAMGVGVLIGRSSGDSGKAAAAPQVISVASTPTATATSSAGTEPTFKADWPSEKTGFTVQLETLPEAGTKVSAVESAKTSASGKGAKDVGALKAEEFASIASTGDYVIYSGVYTKKSEAEKALPALKKSFSGAKVIEVSTTAPGEAPESNKVGESLKKPAPPSVLEKVNKSKGKSYVQKAKELPNVISTG